MRINLCMLVCKNMGMFMATGLTDLISKLRYIISSTDIRISVRDTCILNADIQNSAKIEIYRVEMQITLSDM